MLTIERARNWYLQSDPIHDFDHVLRVYAMAERLAQAEGADLEIVRAAALLHDARGSAPGAGQRANHHGFFLPEILNRKNHHHTSAEFAESILKSEGWPEEKIEAVLHCIRAHRYRDLSEPPQTLEAKVLFDADKLDVLGAIGAVRTILYAALDGKPAYTEPSDQFRQSGLEEPGELHSAYHEYLFKLCKIKDRLFTPTAKVLAEARHTFLVAFFEELRAEMNGKQ